ncbi:hypothetical protein H0H92_010478 [Tricholoma furcatifolium]|nr:hypothetical protein H0H92_010478 [Tricholoma furcatifolium]
MSRPALSPMGPRTRFHQRSLQYASRDSMLTIGEPSPAYPSSPARSETESLPSIVESVVTPPPPPEPSFRASPTPPPEPSFSANASSTPPPTYKVIPILKPATLVQPPTLSFEQVPIQWKALSHDAALWTLDKTELQEIVAGALRRSAPETYIRLLSLENLNTALPAEVERLTNLKASKQTQYRFLVQRRAMTLQALNSSYMSPEKADPDEGISTASRLALQLSQTTADCDKLMSELLVISDQLAQISTITEHHYASALAVAMRKLHKSYKTRTDQLLEARSRIAQLEADYEEAWREAERVAKGIDEVEANAQSKLIEVTMVNDDDEGDDAEGEIVDQDQQDDEEGGEQGEEDDTEEEDLEEEVAVIETAEKMKINCRRASRIIPAEILIQSRRNTGHMEGLPMFTPVSPMPRFSAAVALSSAAPTIATVPESESESKPTPDTARSLGQDRDDAASIRSGKSVRSVRSVRSARSTKSTRSLRSPESTRLSLVSAARTRSTRVSKNNLRLSKPKNPSHPPMPDLPVEFAGITFPAQPLRASHHIWKDIEGRHSLARSRRSSLGDLRPARLSSTSLAPTLAMDDISIRLQSQVTRPLEDEIQVVRRTPPPVPRAPVKPSVSIPNMRVASEIPKATAERSPSVKSVKRTLEVPVQTYHKLKNYTKRYSLPFPLFKSKSTSGSSASAESQSVSSSRSAPMRFN